MNTAMVGLGRMGVNMARRLLRNGVELAAYNRTYEKSAALTAEGAVALRGLAEIKEALQKPRVVWLMLPAGKPVDDHIDALLSILEPNDIIVEGGNSRYTDTITRAARAAQVGVHFVDAGVSGGVWGLENGYCLMVGGSEDAFTLVEPVLRALAPPDGYMRCGPSGSGHFLKMVHNGIEYGLMQAYAEGFDLMDKSPFGPGLDYARVAHLWNQGSVIRSWLLELLEAAFHKATRLQDIRGVVQDSGEGRWTVQEAVEFGVSAPVLSAALFARFKSRDSDAFPERILAALRREFGGHAVETLPMPRDD